MPSARTVGAAILIAAVAVAYGGSLRNGFVFDDAMFVRDDPRVRTLGESRRLFVEPLWGYTDDEAGAEHLHQYYRPLQTFPLAIAGALFPDQAWPAHLLNLALHAANALLVWSILHVLLGGAHLAFGLALLWAVYPAYSEAVLWVSNLAGLGAALSILALFRIHLSQLADTWGGRVLMTLLLLIGLLFHEIAVIAPVLLIAYEITVIRPPRWSRLARECGAMVVALALYAWLRLEALGGVVPGLGVGGMSPWQLAINAVALLPQYIETFLWPFDLNMYHDFDAVSGIADASFLAGATVIVGAGAVFLAAWRRKPSIAFAVAWMAITTAPYVLVRWPQLNVFAERYLYLPSVGVFLLIGVLWQWALQDRTGATSKAAQRTAVVAVLCVALVIIWHRIPDWRDDVTLYTKTLTQSKRALLIRNNLAVHYLAEKRYADGIRILEEAMSMPGVMPQCAHNLGLLRVAAGDDRGAVAAFRQATLLGTPKPSTLLNLGYVLDRVGDRRDAVASYMRILARVPEYVPAWFNLGMIAFETGQYDNARTAVAHVLRSAPDDEALALQRRLDNLAASGKPSTPAEIALTRRQCRRAMQYARRGRHGEANVMLRAAAWLDEAAPLPYQYLANIAALQGDLPTALAEEREALKRAPGNALYQRNIEALERKLTEKRVTEDGR